MGRIARLVACLLPALALLESPRAQRFVPAPRDAHGHLQVAPEHMRGTHFFLERNETIEAFWSRYWSNRPSIEFRLAQLARAGVNYVRLWSSTRAWLAARHQGCFDQDQQLVRPAAGHWDRVADFCDLANQYEIGVALVLFNTFGFWYSHEDSLTRLPPGFVSGASVRAAGPMAVELFLPVPDSGGNDGSPDGAGMDRMRLWVGHQDNADGVGFVSEPYSLFRYRDSWLDGSGGDARHADFVHHYLERMVSAGVAASPGLAEIQVFNEPEAIQDQSHGVHWGEACYRIFRKVGNGPPGNPHGTPRHLAVKGPRSLADRDPVTGAYLSDNAVALESGFDDPSGPPPIELLHHWNMHITPDVHVYVQDANGPRDSTTGAQFQYATGPERLGPRRSFLEDLREHPRIQGTSRGAHLTPKGVVAEETTCRTGTLQRATDLAYYTVRDTDPRRGPRMGNVTWSLLPSDAPLGIFTPSLLPCGFSLSPFEDEAFKDNWRVDASQPNPSAGVAETLDRGLSDYVQVVTGQSTDGRVAVVVWADNFSPDISHAIDSTRPAHARGNRLWYRIRFRDDSGAWQWHPPLAQPPSLLDQSPGPLLFDESRRALAVGSRDQSLTDPRYQQVAGYPPPGVSSRGIDFGDYAFIEQLETSPPPYLRSDLMVRQKRRNAECDLMPSLVFQKQAGNRYRFFLAWSRPVPKHGMNPEERYFPEEDAPAQSYFVPFRNSITDGSAGQREYWKYEVLVQDLTVDPTDKATARVTTQGAAVVVTRGELAEAAPDGNRGNMQSTPLAAGAAGAAAMHPRLFVDATTGHMLLVYMKSQDSWFDIDTEHPRGFLGTPITAWENRSAWHVHPWELCAQVYAEQGVGELRGRWLVQQAAPAPGEKREALDGAALECRVNQPYPRNGLKGWLEDHRIYLQYYSGRQLLNNPASPKAPHPTEFFPAVDPHAVVWTETTAGTSRLRAVVAFKQLNTWTEPDRSSVPEGYETLATEISAVLPGDTQPTGLKVLGRRRLRVAAPDRYPVAARPRIPGGYASREALFDMNEAVVARTPDFGGMGATVVAQNGQRVAMNVAGYDAASQSERLANVDPMQFLTGSRSVFSSSLQCSSAVAPGSDDDVFACAWLHMAPAPKSPRVTLQVWARVGNTGAAVATAFEPQTTPAFAGGDCQARIVALSPTGPGNTPGSQGFVVTWHQSGWLLRAPFLVDRQGGTVRVAPLLPPTQWAVAGGSSMFGEPGFLHSAKLKAAATATGVLWAVKGWVNYRAL